MKEEIPDPFGAFLERQGVQVIDVTPTIEELISLCSGSNGQRFRWLKNCKTHWIAQARAEHAKSSKYPESEIENSLKDIKATGKTPREALENLIKELPTQLSSRLKNI